MIVTVYLTVITLASTYFLKNLSAFHHGYSYRSRSGHRLHVNKFTCCRRQGQKFHVNGKDSTRKQITEFFIATRDMEADTKPKNAVPVIISAGTSRDEAVSSLQKLYQRQKEELEETRALLKRLQSHDSDEEIMDEIDVKGDDNQLSIIRTAASLLSGVDYGFRSRSEGARILDTDKNGTVTVRQSYGPPANIFSLGSQQFMRNLKAMKGEYNDEIDYTLTPYQMELQSQLQKLTLNTTAIWEREKEHGEVPAPFIIKIPYFVLCLLLDKLFEGKYTFNRFFLLETVARMPYFSYITMLHLYETLGFWRRSADMKRIHFAEELNEFRHLLIQESLGGDQQWYVRFLAQHSALVYFTVLCLLWAISPTLSYKFSEMLETHAVHTYGQFLDENEVLLKQLPPSLAAVEYYAFGSSDPFYAEFQTSALAQGNDIRRPGSNMTSLYDAFHAIRDDEADHVSTMEACLDPGTVLRSLSVEKQALLGVALATVASIAISAGAGGSLFDTTTTTATAATDFVFDETALTIMESLAAASGALIQSLFSRDAGAGESAVETSVLLRDLDIFGAILIFLAGVRRFITEVIQVAIKFFSSFLSK
jgi:ubiquinol oxidase